MSTQRQRARAIALVAAISCAGAPFAIATQSDWTLLKVVTASTAVAAAVVLVVLALGPERWWGALGHVIESIQTAPARDASPRAMAWGIWLIVLAYAFAGAHLVWRLAHPVDPWAGDDQGTYLTTAMEIERDGGPSALMTQLWSGEFAEANRHPLYLGLLSIHPEEQFGRFLSALFALIALAMVTRLAWVRFGPWQAGIAAGLVAVNGAWGYFGGMIVCESLLMALTVFVWWQCLRLYDAASKSTEYGQPNESTVAVRRSWSESPAFIAVLIGVGLGLCYLTKGTGIVLLGCVLAWFVTEACVKWRSAKIAATISVLARNSLLTIVAFLIVSSPLIARNLNRYGQPFYNINTYLLFADQYEDFEELLARGDPVGQVAREYLASHTIGDLVRREASGLMWETYMIVRMLGPIPLDDARILFGVPLSLLALIGVLRAPAAHVRWLIVWCLLQWLIFAWYVPIAAGERFVLPILAPLLVYASDGMVSMWKWQQARKGPETT